MRVLRVFAQQGLVSIWLKKNPPTSRRTMTRLVSTISLVYLLSILALSPLRADGPGRLDRDGNPLPEGCIARLGTLTLRGGTLRGCGDPILYSPGGRYFVGTAGPSRSRIAFFDPGSGKRLFELEAGSTGSQLRFSPDGKRLVCPVPGSYHNPVWDMDNRKQIFKFEASQAGFSADGSRLITISFHGRGHCRVLDSTSGQVLQEHSLEADASWAEVLPGGTEVVFHDKAKGKAVLFDWAHKTRRDAFACEAGFGATASPDGKTLALASGQGIRLVDLASGKELANWKGHADGLAVFAHDGRRLAWSGYDESRGMRYSWVVEISGGRPRRAGPPTNSFAAPCFTPDGKAIVILEDGGIPVWRDVDTGKEIHPREGHPGRIADIVATMDGRHLLSRDAGRWLVWDVQMARLVKRYPDEVPAGETVLPRASRFGTGLTVHEATGTLRLRDLVTGRELLKLKGNHGYGGALALSRDGKTAAVAGAAHNIHVYDLDTGNIRLTHQPRATISSMALSDDGRYLTWQTSSEGPFFLDTRTGKELDGVTPFRRGPRNTQDQWLFSGQAEGLKLLSEKKLVAGFGSAIAPTWRSLVLEIVISPDGRYLAISYAGAPAASRGDGRLELRDLDTGKTLSHLQPPSGTFCFSPDSRLLVTSTLEGNLNVWEIASGQLRLGLKGHLGGEVTALAFLPKGRLASGGGDGQVLLWDLSGRAPDGIWHNLQHDPEKLNVLWALLGADDAAKAHRAIWELSADPAGSVAYLARRLEAVPVPGAKLFAQLIADLDSQSFSSRKRASAELAKWGEVALPDIRAALKNPTSLEQARRLKPLLDQLERSDLTGEPLRGVRALEVLEAVGTDEARKLLDDLAQGFAAARLTQEARRALNRWKR